MGKFRGQNIHYIHLGFRAYLIKYFITFAKSIFQQHGFIAIFVKQHVNVVKEFNPEDIKRAQYT